MDNHRYRTDYPDPSQSFHPDQPCCLYTRSGAAGISEGNSPNFAKEGEYAATWSPWLDTLQLYRSIYPKLSSYRLSDLIVDFSLQTVLDELAELYCPEKRKQFHCALYDAFASTLLLKRLCTDPELAPVSLHWLFLQSASTSAARDSLGQLDLF